MKMKSLVLGAALITFSSGVALAECSRGHFTSAKIDIKKAPIAQSTKISEIENIELAAVPTDAWLIKYLA